ncbi:MAG: Fic family protein [Fibromonadales bacterium]|nr:Fic family protein [Fibromonadales bacterium]
MKFQAVQYEEYPWHSAIFDEMLKSKGYNIPAIMLRSESASSSQIENLTGDAIIADNIAAMKKAISLDSKISFSLISEIHKTLLNKTNAGIAGKIREEQVWIGGNNISPDKASFVPPHSKHIKECLADWIAFSNRINLNPIVLVAVSHAQFETIHPFIDGNGRTGRTLIQRILKNNGIFRNSSLPISVGLLNKIGAYYSALNEFHNGDYIPIVKEITAGIIYAVQVGGSMVAKIDDIINGWKSDIKAKESSNVWKLMDVLVENPVVDAKFVAEKLNLSLKSAYNILEDAHNFGMLKPIGKVNQNMKFEAPDITDLVDEVMSAAKMRRS